MKALPSGRIASTRPRHQADISIRIASRALALLCWALAACSSPSVGTSGDAGLCALPLDAKQVWGTCPATFDDTSWRAQVVCFVSEGLTETRCTGFLSRAFDIGGTHGFTCFYDQASKVLVAVQSYDDVPDLRDGCGHQSSVVTAGAVPAMGVCEAPKTLENPCDAPDSGAAADSASSGSTGTDAAGVASGHTACGDSSFFTACVHECGETASSEPVVAACVQGFFQCAPPLIPASDCGPGSWTSASLPCGPWPGNYNCGMDCAVCDATGTWTCGACHAVSAD